MKNVTYINAGAGSGKTFTLTKILSEKLKDTVNPSQVILTTFTELAASEFREKARQKLLEGNQVDAAAQIDSAYIGTVHSVALRFIKKFWYLLEYGAEIQPISERDEEFYMSQSLARIVSERGSNIKLEKEQTLKIFRDFRDYYDISDVFGHPDYLFWQHHLKAIAEKMEYYDVDNVDESINKSKEIVAKVFDKEKVTEQKKKALLEYLQTYYNYIENKGTNEAKEQRKAIKPLLKCKDAHELMILSSKMNKPVGGEKKIEQNCEGYGNFMKELEMLWVSKDNCIVINPFIESIFNLAKEWKDDYAEYKKRNHLISYNDMERLFLHLITNEDEVKNYIRENFRLVMVDEFQDSNPIQLKIFNQLSELIAERDGHSYWVGDPKQAIYGFRGADTDLVNSVSKHFKFYNDAKIHSEEGDNRLGSGRLIESWRSRKTLVELVNAVFIDKFTGEIDPLCIKLEPHFRNDTLTENALAHWSYDKSVSNSKGRAEALAWKVKELLKSGILVHRGKQDEATSEIRPKDVAILCRKNDTIKEIVKALRKYDVPVSESEDAIMQRIEVQLLVTLLQFVQNPTNKHAIADLMRLLWGKTTDEILKERIKYVLNGNNSGKPFVDKWKEDADEIKKLMTLTERFKHLSIPEMVQAIIFECNLPALAQKWGDSRIRQQNLSTVQHLAEEYDQMCLQMGLGASISGFIYYLNSIEPDKEKDNQSDTVKVFTYHGSKGLEWPVVILNELNEDALDPNTLIKKSFMNVREMDLNSTTPENDPFTKKYYLNFFPNIIKGANTNLSQAMQRKIVNSEELKYLYIQLENRTRSEEKRLMYVGMTRAKDYLYTVGLENKYKWLENIGIENPQNDTIWGQPSFKNATEDICMPSEGQANNTIKYSIVEKPDTHTKKEEKYLSPSKIESCIDKNCNYSSHTEWEKRGKEMAQTKWGKDYATIGSCIHDIFAVYKKVFDKTIAQRIIQGYGLEKQLSGSIDAIIQSADWLYATLNEKFPQSNGDKTEREVPFTMSLEDGKVVRGEIDMIWHYTKDGNKHCVLVDYKTFQGVDLKKHTETYYAQLSAYATVMKKAGLVSNALIYYPVHGVIHELRQ